MSRYHHSVPMMVHILIAAALIAWIGVRTQITANRQEAQARTAIEFADQTRACLHDLLAVLNERSKINAANDDILQRRSQLLADLLVEITADENGGAHSEASQWTAIRNKYVPLLLDAQREQEKLVKARDQHPYPAPNCPQAGS